MNPTDNSYPKTKESDDILTSEDVERTANPLTVVHGYIQVLQRRVRRGQAIEGEELLRVLDLMEEASRSLRTGLAALIAKFRSDKQPPTAE